MPGRCVAHTIRMLMFRCATEGLRGCPEVVVRARASEAKGSSEHRTVIKLTIQSESCGNSSLPSEKEFCTAQTTDGKMSGDRMVSNRQYAWDANRGGIEVSQGDFLGGIWCSVLVKQQGNEARQRGMN